MDELKRTDRDLVSLTVLALLYLGPRHTYDMHRQMVLTHKDFVTGLPRSMYHAVNRLLKNGHVVVHDTERSRSRPERTRYRITEAGGEELRSRMHRLLSIPDTDSKLYTAALSFLGVMPIAEVQDALRQRLERLERQLTQSSEELAKVCLPRVLLVEAEFDRARIEAERDWTSQIIDDLIKGELDWPQDLETLRAWGGGLENF